MSQTTETAFETYVEEILLTKGGWKSGANAEWDKEQALFPELKTHNPLLHSSPILHPLENETAKIS